ncbi:MAG: hypothetical protein EON60_13440 [Alphaproteobacteria bacterium]|nr:MAG: hypothetical protein EON60_13440 [Alphaproteobacteria bacterium]
MTVDYAKVKRQLQAAINGCKADTRKTLPYKLMQAYEAMEAKNIAGARLRLDDFERHAKFLGWEGGGAAMPRPFNKPSLEGLFWQANKLAGRDGQPRRAGNKPATTAWWDR